MDRKRVVLPLVTAALGNRFWGVSYLFTRTALQVTTPEIMLSVRFTISLLLMSVPLLLGREKLSFKGKPLLPLIGMAVAETMVFFTESYGILYTNATFAGVFVAVTPIVAMALAALILKEYPARRQILLCLLTVVGVIVGCTMYFFAPQLLSIYITDSPEAIAYGVRRMAYVLIPYCLLGLQDVTSGLLRGLGYSLAPMLVSVLGVCGLRICWVNTVFQLPEFHTLDWLFVSYPISWVVTFAAEIVLYIIVYRRYVRTQEGYHGME